MQDDDTVPVGADVLVSVYSNKYSIGVQLRYKYRLYPSPGQQRALARAFGCARVVFNDALAARQAAYQAGLPYPTDAELSARLTASKATAERAWLGEVSAVVLQQALADLNAAWRNLVRGHRQVQRGAGHLRPVQRGGDDGRLADAAPPGPAHAQALGRRGRGRNRRVAARGRGARGIARVTCRSGRSAPRRHVRGGVLLLPARLGAPGPRDRRPPGDRLGPEYREPPPPGDLPPVDGASVR